MKPLLLEKGERFGKLTVIEYVGTKRYNKKVHRMWKCKCDCGKETIVIQHNLMSGNTQSCGCMRGKRINRELE